MKDFLSRVIDFCATWLPKKSVAYFFLFVVWLVTLWFLSAGNPGPKGGPEIPHIDKVVHFGYFFGGAGLMAAWLGLREQIRKPTRTVWSLFAVVVLVIGCLIGRLDEYHQSFTPGRSGNDMGDWLADILGAIVGAWVMLIHVLPRLSMINTEARESK